MTKLASTLLFVSMFGYSAYAQDTAAASATAPGPGFTDGQIVEILTTINEGELDAAKMANKKAAQPEVKEFAKTMMAEHKKNKKDTKDLAKRLKIDIKKSDASKALKADAKNSNKSLKDAEKAGFDKAYIAQQMSMHEKALKTLDENLIPSAKNPDLKAHLERTRASVSTHLSHAQALQSKML
jgi:putative membrane protein